MKPYAWVALCSLLVLACDHEFEPPDRSAQVAAAAQAYDASMFDDLVWASEQERLTEGNGVYVESCRRCHGPVGRGGTAYARERGLKINSLVDPDWPLAQIDTLRREIFVGHEEGMPIFGGRRLSARQIDAVAGYILQVLRPEVLEEG